MADTHAIAAWLIDGARSAKAPQEVLGELCERLVRAGVRLDRARVYVQTLHPNIMGRSFSWEPGRDVVIGSAPTTMLRDAQYLLSPIARVKESGVSIRRRLSDADCPLDFPVLSELRAEGFTDYLCAPLHFSNGEVHVTTWATHAPGGFAEAEIAGLEAVIVPLARIAEIWALRRVTTTLLNTYVGPQSGAQVLAGRIHRGDIENIEAVIWLSDLRGFTPMADRLPPAEVIERLNRFFEWQTPAITAQGGEVLKFLGDGLLAIFRVDTGRSTAATCTAALDAARATHDAAAKGDDELRYGLALHVGRVSYGNIGSGDRLDFTCIGPAVNMAARLEKIAGEMQRPVVASGEFVRHVPDSFTPLGEFDLKGFSARQPVYALRLDAAAPPSSG